MICRLCGIDKPSEDFPSRGRRCKRCRSLYYKNWYKTNGRKRPSNYLEIQTVWRKNNLEKASAKSAVGRAIKIGKIKRPDRCSLCGGMGRLNGHHIDYKDQLGVVWLCMSCHRRVHTGDIKLDVVS